MFDNIVTKIQGLFSNKFWIAIVLPLLFFITLDIALLEAVFDLEPVDFKALATQSATAIVGQSGVYLLAVFTLGIILQAFQPLMRQALEAGVFFGSYARQRERRAELEQQLDALVELQASTDFGDVEKNFDKSWANAYNVISDPHVTESEVIELAKKQLAQVYDRDKARASYQQLTQALETCCTAREKNGQNSNKTLEALKFKARQAIDFVRQRVAMDISSLYLERDRFFPRDNLMSSAAGNIADAIRSHADARYHMDTRYFWPRLSLQFGESSVIGKRLSEAGTALDFSVLMLFLTVASTGVWLVLVPLLMAPLPLVWLIIAFLHIGFIPLLYLLVKHNLLMFGDTVRSAIDLHRFELLDALGLKSPATLELEREIWRGLQATLVYAQSAELRYTKGKTP